MEIDKDSNDSADNTSTDRNTSKEQNSAPKSGRNQVAKNAEGRAPYLRQASFSQQTTSPGTRNVSFAEAAKINSNSLRRENLQNNTSKISANPYEKRADEGTLHTGTPAQNLIEWIKLAF